LGYAAAVNPTGKDCGLIKRELYFCRIAVILRGQNREAQVLNLFFSKKITRFSASFLLAAAAALLAGCGSGGAGTGPTPTTVAQAISGTVATGAPLAGATVTIKDSAGKTVSGTTAANGTFGIAVTGMTPPFMLVASKAGQQNMYSILPAMDMASTNTQNVNITPVTTLVMYELNGGSDPATMYNSVSFSTVTAANVSARQAFVRSRLPANSINPIFDMMYGQFTATGTLDSTGYDAALDSIGRITGITAASVTFSIAPPYTAGSGAVAGPFITLTLTDPVTAETVTSVSSTNPARVTAIVTNASGTVVPGVIVTFTTSDPRDTFSGGANTALTNASGVATATLTTSNTAGGASTVTASATVSGTAATSSLNYAIGSSTISLSALTLPASLSAYGTASVSVNVLNNGVPYTTPMTVSFTSACAGTGKATLTATVTTVNGTATANYLDNGCNNPSPGDTITATLMNGVTSTGNLPVSSPAVGSIQFVSVVTSPVTNPPMITMKGTGGVNRSETARVTFRVVDSAGNPLGNALVNFSLNTAPGGLTVYPTSATSDPITGNVVTNVTSGIFSTAVRVTAKTGSISSQSDQLLISTGIPAQDAFSLSASAHNIEAWSYDGENTTLTARLADHFHNPVPDGTAVYFTSEGGSVVPSCLTVGGACSAVLTSQELRPNSTTNGYGRVTVLARSTGEEAFIDLENNGVLNGTVDNYLEMIDANVNSTDMGEAYSDYNENHCRDPGTEPYIDFNGNGVYDGRNCGFSPVGGGGDGKYNGLLCTPGAAICSTQKSIDVRSSQIIVFSTSEADITITDPAVVLPAPTVVIALPPCSTAGSGSAGAPYTFIVTVVDRHGNAMPAGTTVAFSSDNATITTDNYIVPDTDGCREDPVLYPGCPATPPATVGSPTFGDIRVTMKSDAVFTPLVPGTPPAADTPAKCTNPNTSGTFTVKVTSPKGIITTATMPVTD